MKTIRELGDDLLNKDPQQRLKVIRRYMGTLRLGTPSFDRSHIESFFARTGTIRVTRSMGAGDKTNLVWFLLSLNASKH